ncbi:hypothetical protein EUA93_19405 [Nocardioides oleivorans]|uniref:Lysyl oxidase n=1 Tax=Nocardioides oleivorans TaxID=273676 RepID=A0A4Q2RTD4_9ACTN|nr:lysyl oxidase family protein [Nocardioides oleivorans]RYB91095.1 hypothetical protein EUA93_19405 [Nocardioides oleivorans]
MTPRALLSSLGSGLLVVGLAATGVAAATTATAAPTATTTAASSARAADAQARIQLWAPDRVEAFSEGGRTYPPFGLRVIAPDSNVEVWSHRASFEDPIVSEVRTPTGTTRLPAGSMKDFTGIDGFIVLDVRKVGSSRKVVHRSLDACLAATGERARPDAPATSPYPRYCPYSPFTLGSVMGVQQGWAANVFESSGLRPLPIGPGTYVVESRVAKRYWSAFGLTAATATTSTRMNVVEAEGCQDCGRAGGHASEPGHLGRYGRPGARPTEKAGGSAAGAVPDLRSLPAFGIELNRKATTLRFSATVWNAGSSPLVIDGFRRRDAEVMDAYQYFFDTDGNQTGYQQVGTMEFHHANHNHWHFEDFARYDLLDANKKYVSKSRKQSFCLANTDAVDYTVPGADWQPENTDLATACGDEGALSIREVLASGSGDTYAQYRAGQAFKIGDLPNGVYYIRVEGNPERNLTESDTTNNVADRRIRIGGKGADRWVKAAPIGDIVEPPTFFRGVS